MFDSYWTPCLFPSAYILRSTCSTDYHCFKPCAIMRKERRPILLLGYLLIGWQGLNELHSPLASVEIDHPYRDHQNCVRYSASLKLISEVLFWWSNDRITWHVTNLFTTSHALELAGTVILMYLFSVAVRKWSKLSRFNEAAHKYGCKPAKRYPNWDPLLGLDLFATIRKADYRGQRSQEYAQLHKTYGDTFEMKTLSTVQVQIT